MSCFEGKKKNSYKKCGGLGMCCVWKKRDVFLMYKLH